MAFSSANANAAGACAGVFEPQANLPLTTAALADRLSELHLLSRRSLASWSKSGLPNDEALAAEIKKLTLLAFEKSPATHVNVKIGGGGSFDLIIAEGASRLSQLAVGIYEAYGANLISYPEKADGVREQLRDYFGG